MLKKFSISYKLSYRLVAKAAIVDTFLLGVTLVCCIEYR